MFETLAFWVVVVGSFGLFAAQMSARWRLMQAAPGAFSVDQLPRRVERFVVEVVFQGKVIARKPWVGMAHLFVFWGFVAFGGYTLVETLHGLGLVDLTDTVAFTVYRVLLVPFCVAVLLGIVFLAVRRGLVRPRALGATVSKESLLIAGFIAVLMITFLLELFVLGEGPAARVNWWVHMLVIFTFLVLVPNSKHLHLILSPGTVFLKAPVLGTVPNLDFEKEEVGLETVKDLPKKAVLDAFTCVECGRCMENCPATATGKLLNPKTLVLQNEEALLAGRLDAKLSDVYDPDVLWQCTTCGACEDACPVGIEHTPVIIGARRGLVSNGEAPDYLAPVYNNLERRGNLWGQTSDVRQKFVAAAQFETFDPEKHEYLLWLGCAGGTEPDFQKSLRSLGDILRAQGKTFGVLSKERCTGDVAKRTGNEYQFQELATANVEDLQTSGVKKVVTSCPHCLKTLGHDYKAFGFEGKVVHSSVLVEQLTRYERPVRLEDEPVTFHDPCYLGRYAGEHEAPRALLERYGGDVTEPERTKDNPFCCGAGGGLLFEEHEAGTRISQTRFEQLQATGANTIVMGCPFCSIMLKGAKASTPGTDEIQMVDLMTWTEGRLRTAGRLGQADGAGTAPASEATPE
ncbi:(Fe-S)-binding protein [Luteitalea sp.]|uniref:(Fe-S)-binding protein n=1 Tax=Luteitalea sp. TaxID=2004800 RepID=UPI0025BD551A|nr:(Fe-S)-binding protein [Luteitalea sp.]